MQKITIAIFFMLFISNISTAQTQDIQRVIGPSPNVASLFKFNDQPISLYTGTSQTQIPVYNIKLGKIELPINLMYHSAGFKVTENASWTGLGWALNAGGAVTTSAYGLDDITFLNQRITKSNPTKCELTSIMDGHYDSQPDIFYFNFLGQSGQFYFNDNLQIVQMPHSKIKIELIFLADVGNVWKITNTDGTVFLFNQREINPTTRETVNGNSGGTILNGGGAGSFNHPDVSSQTWFLTKIISPTGDSVMFTYENYSAVSEYFKGESKYFQQSGVTLTQCGNGSAVPVPNNISSYEFQRINGFRLKSIISRNGTVNFITGANRCDLLGDKYLSEIDVLDLNGSIIKKLLFTYNYLIGSSLYTPAQVNCSSEVMPSIGNVDVNQPSLKRRLMLMEVDEVNPATNQIDNSYKMDYETGIGLPSRFSTEQDTWGYYNGNSQTSLLQNLQQSTQNIQNINVPIITGRDPSLQFAKQGILKKITFPTGGSSSFTYELNSVSSTSANGCGSSIVISDLNATISATSNNQLVTSFTVNHCSGGDNITFKISNCNFTTSMSPSTVLPYGFYIKSNNTTILSSNDIINRSNGQPQNGATFYLPNGSYSIYSFSSSGPNCSYSLLIPGRSEPQFIAGNGTTQTVVGGLRIQQVVETDNTNNSSIIKSYDYTKSINGTLTSSGVLASTNSSLLTNCFITARDLDCGTLPQGVSGTESAIVPMMTLSSNTNYPLTLTHGAVVGYGQVTEKRKDNNSNDLGYTLYNFSTPTDEIFQINTIVPSDQQTTAPSSNGDFYPFAPPYSHEWERGLLLKREDYKNNGNGNYSVIKREQNFYSSKSVDVTHGIVPSYYLNSVMGFTNQCNPTFGNGYNPYSIYKFTTYYLYSQYSTLDYTIKENFDDNLNSIKSTTYYNYNTNNLLPNSIKTINSKQEVITSNLKYPLDYTVSGSPSNTAAQGIQNLQNQNIITPVIENYVQKTNADGSGLITISSVLSTYKPTIPLPDVFYNWEPASRTASFTPTTITNSSITSDVYYQPKISFDLYGSYGNILQQHKINNANHSYIWDYNQTYPIAEIVNASQTNIAYTSFEADGTGNWTLSGGTVNTSVAAITGNKSYNLSGTNTISKTGLASGNYIVSYWTKGVSLTVNGSTASLVVSHNGWNFYKHSLTGVTNVTVSGTGTMDELRLYPSNAQMTTYTYNPLIGISSQCDANNRLSYYNYDGLNRLKDIKDQDGNILKVYDYQYQQTK